MSKIYNKTNFHKHTFCVFQEVTPDKISNLTLNYTSKSGSKYYFTPEGVYRYSNHWGRAANCKWRLNKLSLKDKKTDRNAIGFARWDEFYIDNDYEKLYFIEVNHSTQSAHFYHKESSNFTANQILRTSGEITKLLRQIRVLFDDDSWCKYLKGNDIEVIRREIIDKLISSNKTFQEIRKDYL